MTDTKYNLIAIVGPTASGKTSAAVRLAALMGSEIISADSRQVYRGMDLGTGKDLHEFTVNGVSVPYHMIDIVDPGYEFNLFEYQKRFYECFTALRARGIVPVLVGGTGLYIEAVIKGYEMVHVPVNDSLREELEGLDMAALEARLKTLTPRVHNTTDLLNRNRLVRAIEIADYSAHGGERKKPSAPDIRPFVIGVRWQRDVLQQRITTRLRERFEAGMVDEVRRLHASGTSWERLAFLGLEYRYISLYLQGDLTYEEMFTTLNTRIRRFAKRQETWFRKMERQGTVIHWVEQAALKT